MVGGLGGWKKKNLNYFDRLVHKLTCTPPSSFEHKRMKKMGESERKMEFSRLERFQSELMRVIMEKITGDQQPRCAFMASMSTSIALNFNSLEFLTFCLSCLFLDLHLNEVLVSLLGQDILNLAH